MKTLLAVTALSLSATFGTSAFAQSADVDAAIAGCIADPSACVALFEALDLSALSAVERAAAVEALTTAAAENPSLAAAFTEVASAVETGSSVYETIVASFSSAA